MTATVMLLQSVGAVKVVVSGPRFMSAGVVILKICCVQTSYF